MANPWFKMHAGFRADPKIQSMSEVMQRRWLMLLCLRCSNELLDLRDDEIRWALHISERQWAVTKTLFIEKGFIDEDMNILDWDKSQYLNHGSERSEQPMTGTERSRKCRASKKTPHATDDATDDATDMQRACNADATDMQRACNADATDATLHATKERCTSVACNPVDNSEKSNKINYLTDFPSRARATDTEQITETETELEKIKDNATGFHPVAPRAQAHATPTAAPPVDNFPQPQGLATVQGNTPEFPDSSTAPEPAEPTKPDKPPAVAKRKKAPPGLSIAEVVAECEADPQHVQDWFTARKVPLTRTALDGLKRESGKAGISPAEAIRICAENGWRGFKASWYANQTVSHNTALARASPQIRNPLAPWEAAQAAQNQAILLAKRKIFGEVIDATV